MEEEYVIYTRNLASQMTQAGLLKKMPNMDTLFDFTFLEKTTRSIFHKYDLNGDKMHFCRGGSKKGASLLML